MIEITLGLWVLATVASFACYVPALMHRGDEVGFLVLFMVGTIGTMFAWALHWVALHLLGGSGQ